MLNWPAVITQPGARTGDARLKKTETLADLLQFFAKNWSKLGTDRVQTGDKWVHFVRETCALLMLPDPLLAGERFWLPDWLAAQPESRAGEAMRKPRF